MKSQWTIYLLLIIVLMVWGLVAWKIFMPNREIVQVSTLERFIPVSTSATRDTLRLNYTDPFLKVDTPSKVILQANVRDSKQSRSSRERLQFVHIGVISVPGRQLHIVTNENNRYELEKGDTIACFRLCNYDADSIYFEKGGVIYGVKRCE